MELKKYIAELDAKLLKEAMDAGFTKKQARYLTKQIRHIYRDCW